MIHEEYEEDNFTNIYMKEKFTQKTKISWDSLVRYVKYNVFKYDVEQRLSNNIVLKLQELSYGRIMGNKNQCSTCHYIFDEILLTFNLLVRKALSSFIDFRISSIDNSFKFS